MNKKIEELQEWLNTRLLDQTNSRTEFEERVNNKIDLMINQNIQDRRDMGQAIIALRKELNDELDKFRKDIVENTLPNVSNITSGHVIVSQGTEVPKFKNNKEKHPYKFLEELEIYFKKMNTREEDKLEILRECMQETAFDWFSIYKLCWNTYDDFRNDFLDYFWSEAEQNQLRQQINTSIWKPGGMSMANHFAHYIGMAKTLKEPWPENLLIDQIMRHFPRYIQSMWTLVTDKNFKTAAEFLRHQDNIGRATPSASQRNILEPFSRQPGPSRPAPYSRPNQRQMMQPLCTSTPKNFKGRNYKPENYRQLN